VLAAARDMSFPHTIRLIPPHVIVRDIFEQPPQQGLWTAPLL